MKITFLTTIALALAPLGAWTAVEGRIVFFPDIEGTTGVGAIRYGAFVHAIRSFCFRSCWAKGFCRTGRSRKVSRMPALP